MLATLQKQGLESRRVDSPKNSPGKLNESDLFLLILLGEKIMGNG